ncbi:MAG: hypothetical protein LWX11_04560 [Firmicutes bacterium]|nr:hypothetical protein [Bacillota bacterium]
MVAILGIIGAIAIPRLVGARQHARNVGDAQANAHTIRMLLESRKAENGTYGAASTYTWNAGVASDAAFLPQFTPSGNSKMNYSLTVLTPLTYELTVTDPVPNRVVYRTNQNGDSLPI